MRLSVASLCLSVPIAIARPGRPVSAGLPHPSVAPGQSHKGFLDNKYSAQDVVELLNLTANPEKGYYTQTYIDPQNVPGTNRSYSTAIYYLLEGSAGQSLWHSVDAPEVWHHYLGAAMEVSLSWNNGTAAEHLILGKDIWNQESPQIVIDRFQFQRVRSLGDWTLVGTTVAPAFVASGYVIESEGWVPDGGN